MSLWALLEMFDEDKKSSIEDGSDELEALNEVVSVTGRISGLDLLAPKREN